MWMRWVIRSLFRPLKPGALDWLLPLLETYPPEARANCTVYPPLDRTKALFLHPGEPVFDRFRSYVCSRFAEQAMRGAVFVDPTARQPYYFHLAQVIVSRKADPDLPTLNREEALEYRLVGLRQEVDGTIEECSPEYLLLLRGSSDLPHDAIDFAVSADDAVERARTFALEQVAENIAEQYRQQKYADLPERRVSSSAASTTRRPSWATGAKRSMIRSKMATGTPRVN